MYVSTYIYVYTVDLFQEVCMYGQEGRTLPSSVGVCIYIGGKQLQASFADTYKINLAYTVQAILTT